MISEWFDIWNALTDINDSEHLFVNKSLAKINTLKIIRTISLVNLYKLYPLQFWFNRFIFFHY